MAGDIRAQGITHADGSACHITALGKAEGGISLSVKHCIFIIVTLVIGLVLLWASGNYATLRPFAVKYTITVTVVAWLIVVMNLIKNCIR